MLPLPLRASLRVSSVLLHLLLCWALVKLPDFARWQARAEKAVYEYHLTAAARTYRILSLDGGGIRGYMTMRIISDLISRWFPGDALEGQVKFASTIDYFGGTSTGGLIAFCCSVNYPLGKMQSIYTEGRHYFQKQGLARFGLPPLFSSKYNPKPIHDRIDIILGEVFTQYDVSARKRKLYPDHPESFYGVSNFTLGDLDQIVFKQLTQAVDRADTAEEKRRRRVLILNSYDVTDNKVRIFNTRYMHHRDIRVADVLKSTMAAPTYFPPHIMNVTNSDGEVSQHGMIDGGVYANDPELTALWATRMNTHTLNTYRILSIGTGSYTAPVNIRMGGGYWGWLIGSAGLIVSTILQSSSEFTEAIVASLARFSNIRRFKLNCDILKDMQIDDVTFPTVFNREWAGHTVKEDGRTVNIPPFSKSPDVRAMHSYYKRFFKDEIDMQHRDPLNQNVQADASKHPSANM